MKAPYHYSGLLQKAYPAIALTEYAAMVGGVRAALQEELSLPGMLLAGAAFVVARSLDVVLRAHRSARQQPNQTSPAKQMPELEELTAAYEETNRTPQAEKRFPYPLSPNDPFVLGAYVRKRRKELQLTMKGLCEKLAGKARQQKTSGRTMEYNPGWFVHLENNHFTHKIPGEQIDPLLKALGATREEYLAFVQQFIHQKET